MGPRMRRQLLDRHRIRARPVKREGHQDAQPPHKSANGDSGLRGLDNWTVGALNLGRSRRPTAEIDGLLDWRCRSMVGWRNSESAGLPHPAPPPQIARLSWRSFRKLRNLSLPKRRVEIKTHLLLQPGFLRSLSVEEKKNGHVLINREGS